MFIILFKMLDEYLILLIALSYVILTLSNFITKLLKVNITYVNHKDIMYKMRLTLRWYLVSNKLY